MEKHKIGGEYNILGKKYTLVLGEDCKLCDLKNDNERCISVPVCDYHRGHYKIINNEEIDNPIDENILSVLYQYNEYLKSYIDENTIGVGLTHEDVKNWYIKNKL